MPYFSDIVRDSILAPTAGGPSLPSVTRPSTMWARPSVSVAVGTFGLIWSCNRCLPNPGARTENEMCESAA